jgi:hypothetical protein
MSSELSHEAGDTPADVTDTAPTWVAELSAMALTADRITESKLANFQTFQRRGGKVG